MTEVVYKGMNKDAILASLSEGAERTDSGLLIAQQQQIVVRQFNIITDNITVPTTSLHPEDPNSIEGDVSEIDLKEAGMNVEWLLQCGAIEEVGSMVVATA